MTVPLDMACSGVPVGAPTSRPSWVLPTAARIRGDVPPPDGARPAPGVAQPLRRRPCPRLRRLRAAGGGGRLLLCARGGHGCRALGLAGGSLRRLCTPLEGARLHRGRLPSRSEVGDLCVLRCLLGVKDDPLVDGEGEGGAGRSGLGEASLGATGLDRGCPTAGDHQGRDRGARQEPGTGAECPTQAHGRSGGTVAAGIPALGGGKDHGWRLGDGAGPSTVRGRPVVLRPPSTACG